NLARRARRCKQRIDHRLVRKALAGFVALWQQTDQSHWAAGAIYRLSGVAKCFRAPERRQTPRGRSHERPPSRRDRSRLARPGHRMRPDTVNAAKETAGRLGDSGRHASREGRLTSMLITPNRRNLNTVVVLNPKGGCGKTTLVTNLASIYAARGPMPAVMEYDPQGSTMRWIEKRPSDAPPIHGIAAYKNTMQTTRSWQLRVPIETRTLLIDSPAGLTHDGLRSM